MAAAMTVAYNLTPLFYH